MAILSIIALGVGFFSGVRITTPAMVHTVNAFWQEKQLYDYRLLSTLGWDEDNVKEFQNMPDVRYAEGANSIDILALNNENTEVVLKAHTIPENINQLRLTEGRMPQSDNECLMDASRPCGLEIGDTIKISQDNEEDTLDTLNDTEFKIVGMADSALYVNFERGTTSIGNGSVEAFVYLLPDAFDRDYYSEIYIRFDHDSVIYSKEYKDAMEQCSDSWEELTQQQADSRYQRIVDDAESELQDGKDELEDKRSEGQQELDDAEKELADGKKELDDAEKELADGRKELDDAQKELSDAKQQIEDNEKKIDNAQKELDDVKQQLDDSEQQLNEAKQQLDDSEQQLNEARLQLDDSEQQLNEAKQQLDDSRIQLDSAEQQITDGERQLNAGQVQIDSAFAEVRQNEEKLTTSENELNAQEQALNAQLSQIPWEYLTPEQQAQFSYAREQIAQGRIQIEAGKQQISSAYQELNIQQENLNQKRRELEVAKSEYEAGKIQYEAGLAQYENGLMQFQEGRTQYEDGLKQFEEGKAQYEDGLKQLEDGKAQYENGVKELEDARQKLADGKKEYEDGLLELEEGRQKYQDGVKELEDGKKEYENGLQEYQDGKKEFSEKIADAEAEIADAEQEIADIEKPDTYVLDRNTNISYACFESDSQIVEQVAKVFPIFFILVAAMVCITTMNRMVEEQRTQIGTLKALGYSESDIMGKFAFYCGTAAVIGCVLGYAVGTVLFPSVIWMSYELMYIEIPLTYIFDWKLSSLSLLASLLCSIGTTWIACHVELSETAAGLMRPKAPKAGKRVFLEYFPFIWNRLKFLYKVSIRNMFRYKGRFFMMVLGVGGCTALLLTGFGLKDTVAGFADVQYNEIVTADAEASFKTDIGETIPTELENSLDSLTEEYMLLNLSSWDILYDDNKVKALNMIIPVSEGNFNNYMHLHTTDGEPLSLPDVDEILVSNSVMERFGAELGKTITLRNEDMEELHVKVTGVFENHVYNYIILSSDTLQKQLGRIPTCNAAYMNFPEETDEYQISAELSKNEHITTVSLFSEMQERMAKTMGSLDYIVLLVIVCAAGLAFIVLYNLTNINITERIREIATIKVLGFFRNETSAYVLRENIALTAVGIIVGLGLGILLHSFVISQIIVDLVSFKTRILPMSFIYSILLTFLFNIAVNAFMGIKLEKINMAESLKSIE